MPVTTYEPPDTLSREEVVRRSESVLSRSDIPINVHEDIVRIQSLGLDWDIGCKVFEPRHTSRIAAGADGRRVGVFMLHGGSGDHRRFDTFAPLLAGKLGYKCVCMTYPGRLYLDDPSRNWPGDTLYPDGTARTPQWKMGLRITPDQYEVIKIVPEKDQRRKWGTLFFAAAKEGTEFYDRMAAWPAAFEDAMRELCRRYFPPQIFSIYSHGHSTGGPFAHALLQRVENVVGLVGIESSPFGVIYGRMSDGRRDDPFHCLGLRTWRDEARYVGYEAGPDAYRQMPLLMEKVFEAWDRIKHLPQFKTEWGLHFGMIGPLADGARAAARRLAMNREETDALVRRFQDMARPLSDPGVKPVPPILYGITANSADHKPEKYLNVALPALAELRPAPKVRLVRYEAGIHDYSAPEPDLPWGVGGAAAQVWAEAIEAGYYLSREAGR